MPFFDLETAADIAELADESIVSEISRQWTRDFVSELAATGLLERVGGMHRIHASLRETEAELAITADRETVNRALNLFVTRAVSTLKKPLAAVMGPSGSRVVVRSLRAASNPDSVDAFDELIDTVHRSARVGRRHDASAAADILRRYSLNSDRRLLFLEGLARWQVDDHEAAAPIFDEVLASDSEDKAAGIASHLLGLHLHRQGRDPRAVALLEQSERILEALGDYRGLAITRTSFAQVIRETALDEPGLEHSLQKYASARAALLADPATTEGEARRSEGRILLGEGQAEFALGHRELGIERVRSALDALHSNPSSAMWVRVVLAALYRDNDQPAKGRDVLHSAVESALATNRRDFQLAQGLNILASIERRLPQHSLAAWQHAVQSVSLGEELRDYRHLVHASQTLAQIDLDRLIENRRATAADVRQVKQRIYKAQVWASKVHDATARERLRGFVEEADNIAHSRGLIH
ncbi:hypothetical protein [Agrococcus sp. UYP33]